jgi:hypothetical protein
MARPVPSVAGFLHGRDHVLEHDNALALEGPVLRRAGLHLLQKHAQFLPAIIDGDGVHGSALLFHLPMGRERVGGGGVPVKWAVGLIVSQAERDMLTAIRETAESRRGAWAVA